MYQHGTMTISLLPTLTYFCLEFLPVLIAVSSLLQFRDNLVFRFSVLLRKTSTVITDSIVIIKGGSFVTALSHEFVYKKGF